MTPTLTISRLTKRFQSVEALKSVSLALEPGRRAALLGHNGAGKSTMMKIVLGLIPFDSGEVSVCGSAPGSPAARTQVAYLPENVAFHPALTGEEQLRHYLALRGENPKQATELLARVGLGHAARRRIGTYSKGMRQRVGLAQTLIGRPVSWCWTNRPLAWTRCRDGTSMTCSTGWPQKEPPSCSPPTC